MDDAGAGTVTYRPLSSAASWKPLYCLSPNQVARPVRAGAGDYHDVS